ncbi:MAG: sensor domain-containing diguanylate cyclase [Candidatus Villigracilaceae bacterium]
MSVQWDSLPKIRQAIANSGLSQAEQQRLISLIEILSVADKQANDGQTPDVDALLAVLQRQAKELDTLRQLSNKLTASLNLQMVLQMVASEAMDLIENCKTINIFLYDADSDRLEFGTAMDENGVKSQPFSDPRPEGLSFTVAHKREMILVEDISRSPLFQNAPADWSGSIVGIPLKFNEKIIGVMNISRLTTGAFSDMELRLLHLLAEQAAIAISNARLHTLLNHQAYTDSITGLPNRRALDEYLEREIEKARRILGSFTLVMMDLDNFKQVNDAYGHRVGDQILRVTFNYLAHHLRSGDFLARFGDDELTLILSDTDLPDAIAVCKKLAETTFNHQVQLPDLKQAHISISGGIAVYPTHSRTAEGLLRAADEALYRTKKSARGTFAVARILTDNVQTSPRQK